jgi:ABC-2 type transport system permease protein
MELYVEVAKRAFQRQLAYRTANLAGMVTNAFFGYVRAAVFLAAFQTQETIAGYDAQAAVTFTWITQAIIMVVVLWGWWDVEVTIRSGDVVSDLSKPFSYLGFWLARDYGRAVYFVLFRCIPILLVGQVVNGLRWPQHPATWLALAVSLTLAVTLSFAWRFMINLSAFWTTDARGLGGVASTLVLFFSGFVVPIRFFPDWLRGPVAALPFAGISQIPADIFLERFSSYGVLAALAHQAVWSLVLLGACQWLVAVATRRVVTQGG